MVRVIGIFIPQEQQHLCSRRIGHGWPAAGLDVCRLEGHVSECSEVCCRLFVCSHLPYK